MVYKSSIYIIKCLTTNDAYIGITNIDVNQRKAQHKYESTYSNKPVHKFIRENGGWDNFTFNILARVEYEDCDDKHRFERMYYDLYKPTLNKNVPNRKPHEYYLQVVKA
jgi:hypothetical protein